MTHAASDVDLLVVADLPGDPATHTRRARQLAADCFPPLAVVFATPQDVVSAEIQKPPFLSSIPGSGVVVYRRT